jgi:GxxExxY protein
MVKSMPNFEGKHSDITRAIIAAFYDVYNELGYGFSEKIYENALALEMSKRELIVEIQCPVDIYYCGQVVGKYCVDILVNGLVILELKSVKELTDEHNAQLLNYLKATQIEVGLLLNFGPRAAFKRMVFDNYRKGSLSWISPKEPAVKKEKYP